MSEHLLTIKNLHIKYDTDEGEEVRAVNGVDLTLDKGRSLGLVGETGAGKTTTALAVLKLLPKKVGSITEGQIVLDGKDITAATEEDMRLLRGNTVSMIFQDPMTSLNPVLPVGEQIMEVISLHRKDLTKEQLEKRLDEILTMVGIPPERRQDYPHQFSGGMKQRIVIAIALVCEPKLLLADEPTTALDVTIQAQVLDMMRSLRERMDTAMILITHDLGVVAENCDEVAIMYAGEIIEYGAVEDIFERENHHPYTVGLFGAIPDMTKDERRLHPIDGLMADPTDLPRGCKFAPRCPHCMPVCETEQPRFHTENGHSIRCHLFGAPGSKPAQGGNA
ncbi:ABC transporter ATP-binding protein [Feifania hominis]|uniref:ABC transporter ATP-binding protein n=1 Tax=Feifania hominis TaxID=2763660 RepID=A0A926DFR5_9FIRM|nr:ABC transporter ATP-binding protein [Feifania hominis]MBC8537027.1 ABC transporter ATP-binding protein [Feifania hominis]